MKSFKTHIKEAAKANLHMTHQEDSMYIDGYAGFRASLGMMSSVLSRLSGYSKSKINVSTKIDGCVHENTIIKTSVGEMTIQAFHERFNSGENLSVMGKDFIQDGVEIDRMVEVHNSYCHSGNKEWVEIQLENGSSVKLTADHEVHTRNRGWVKAGELLTGDDITEL